jgi:hypothetical protein
VLTLLADIQQRTTDVVVEARAFRTADWTADDDWHAAQACSILWHHSPRFQFLLPGFFGPIKVFDGADQRERGYAAER